MPLQTTRKRGRPKGSVDHPQKLHFRDECLKYAYETKHPKAVTQIQKDVRRAHRRMFATYLHYAFGKPVESVEHSGPGGGPIQFQQKFEAALQAGAAKAGRLPKP